MYGSSTRTTSALEAYNGVLGRLISKHGNFFKFVRILQSEELAKGRDFALLISSGGACVKSKRRKRVTERYCEIDNAYKDLQSGKITASMFLNRMTFPKNNVCTDMEPEEDIFDDIHYLRDEDEDEDLHEPIQQPVTANICVICLVAEPNTVMMPCKHFKTCNECVLKLQAGAIGKGQQSYQCPVCRVEVEDVMTVFI